MLGLGLTIINKTKASNALKLTFDTFQHANDLISGDASTIQTWNNFFNLPSNGNPFTSITVDNNVIYLFGGSNIHISSNRFQGVSTLLKFEDYGAITVLNNYAFYFCGSIQTLIIPKVTSIGNYALGFCTSLNKIILPNVLTINDYCFYGSTNINEFYLPKCTNIGSTTNNNGVFLNITGKTIKLTISSSLNNSNDDDIAYLTSNNTVTLVTV